MKYDKRLLNRHSRPNLGLRPYPKLIRHCGRVWNKRSASRFTRGADARRYQRGESRILFGLPQKIPAHSRTGMNQSP